VSRNIIFVLMYHRHRLLVPIWLCFSFCCLSEKMRSVDISIYTRIWKPCHRIIFSCKIRVIFLILAHQQCSLYGTEFLKSSSSVYSICWRGVVKNATCAFRRVQSGRPNNHKNLRRWHIKALIATGGCSPVHSGASSDNAGLTPAFRWHSQETWARTGGWYPNGSSIQCCISAFCAHSNVPSGCMEFLDKLSNYLIFKEDATPLNHVVCLLVGWN
jgi:hypothetical protein